MAVRQLLDQPILKTRFSGDLAYSGYKISDIVFWLATLLVALTSVLKTSMPFSGLCILRHPIGSIPHMSPDLGASKLIFILLFS